MQIEIWENIIGYEGLYQVSSLGNIKSIARIVAHQKKGNQFYSGRMLKSETSNCGYKRIQLCKSNLAKPYSIHRIVALTFIPNPNSYPQVNHIDGNKGNNYIDNLEWCNASENQIHYIKLTNHKNKYLGKFNEDHPASKIVNQYDLNGNFLKQWASTLDAGRNGYNSNGISQCANGDYKSSNGYLWRYQKGNIKIEQKISLPIRQRKVKDNTTPPVGIKP